MQQEVPTGSIKPSEGLNAGSGSYFASNTESASPSLSVGYKATGKPVQLQPTAPPSHQHAPHALSDLMSHFESVKQRCKLQSDPARSLILITLFSCLTE
jgi:hypothetical protein